MAIMGIYKKYGFPKLTADYGTKVIPDPLTMNVFLGVFLLLTQPYILAILPVFFSELTSFTPSVLQVKHAPC